MTDLTNETEHRWRDHYNRTARQYDWKETLWGLLLGYSDGEERRAMVERLRLEPSQRLLEVNAGTGSNLVLAAGTLTATGRMVAQDIAVEALKVCRAKLQRKGAAGDFVESDAAHLPFRSNAFDAVLSFGGISQFGDRNRAIDEMVRVVRPGGRVVIGDVGVRLDKRGSLRRKLLLWLNPRYATQPPTHLLANLDEVCVDWIRNDSCYLAELVKPSRETGHD